MQKSEQLAAMTRLEFQQHYRIGHDKFYREIAAGRLRAVKVGAKTIVLPEDRKAWEASLPQVNSQ